MPSPKKEKPSILDQDRVKELIQNRDIKPEDFPLIEELAKFSNRLFIEMLHNTFNGQKAKSLQALESDIKSTQRKAEQLKGDSHLTTKVSEQLALLELMKRFASKYDWTVCYNLVRVFEEKE